VGGAIRVGFILQDPDQPKKMSEFHMDQGHYSNAVELRLHGAVTDWFSWTADFNAVLDGDGVGGAQVGGTIPSGAAVKLGGSTFADFSIEDLIAQFKAADEFQIWAGRLLVPSDRSNFSGPFFTSPWNYQGFYVAGSAPIGPMEGPNGRNQGITVWGNVADAKFKYYVGAYGLDQGGPQNGSSPAGANPFYSARLSYTLQGSEPGYFGSSTYYGDKDVVTIAVGGQYQKDGSSSLDSSGVPNGGKKDTFIGMADILAEENVTGAGTFTFEGQFYAFNSGYNFGTGVPGLFSPREAFYGLFTYLTPEPLGIGKLQPQLRWQQTVNPAWTIIDAGLAYVMKAYDARVVLTYEHIDTGHTAGTGPERGLSNSLQIGVQLQK